jgi:hypothetical protein
MLPVIAPVTGATCAVEAIEVDFNVSPLLVVSVPSVTLSVPDKLTILPELMDTPALLFTVISPMAIVPVTDCALVPVMFKAPAEPARVPELIRFSASVRLAPEAIVRVAPEVTVVE